MPFLEVDRVTKIYESNGSTITALGGVSLEAVPGEWIAIMGPSGCGKSTLLNLCGAMDFPNSGSVTIGGANTSRLDDKALTKLRREKIGFIFQSFQLLQALSALENVETPLLLARTANARKVAQETLAWVGLEESVRRMPHQLSGGEQQRVAIARALVSRPALILADEPTGNLDTKTGETILKLLRRIVFERNAVVLMATHSMEAAAKADRVVRLRDGIIAEET
jgi:ABC-type lipoprotein export system ATPase subunit